MELLDKKKKQNKKKEEGKDEDYDKGWCCYEIW